MRDANRCDRDGIRPRGRRRDRCLSLDM